MFEKIAPARTFGLCTKPKPCGKQGLIRGASMENAIVLSRRRMLNRYLRFADEFRPAQGARLIGDLALIGSNSGIGGCRPRGSCHCTPFGVAYPARQVVLGRNTLDETTAETPIPPRPASASEPLLSIRRHYAGHNLQMPKYASSSFPLNDLRFSASLEIVRHRLNGKWTVLRRDASRIFHHVRLPFTKLTIS